MEENRKPSEFILSALETLYTAECEFSEGIRNSGISHECYFAIISKFNETRDAILRSDNVASLFAFRANADQDSYSDALDFGDVLKKTIDIAGPFDAISIVASRAYAEACDCVRAEVLA